MSDLITISQEKYDELISDHLFLNCLIAAGVDNWEGYDLAVEEYQERELNLDEED